MDCFAPNFKLKYEDSENIKANCVSTVVFNLHQIKRQALIFLRHPLYPRQLAISLTKWEPDFIYVVILGILITVIMTNYHCNNMIITRIIILYELDMSGNCVTSYILAWVSEK